MTKAYENFIFLLHEKDLRSGLFVNCEFISGWEFIIHPELVNDQKLSVGCKSFLCFPSEYANATNLLQRNGSLKRLYEVSKIKGADHHRDK